MMNRFLLPLAVAAMALGSAVAFAESETSTATAEISTIDTATHQLTLSDGVAYTMPEGFDASALTVGEKVTVEWKDNAGAKEVVSVKAAE